MLVGTLIYEPFHTFHEEIEEENQSVLEHKCYTKSGSKNKQLFSKSKVV